MNRQRSTHDRLAAMIRTGTLVPVQVFGTESCCQHGAEGCESIGYGLCDRFSTHAPSGSDCNRAEFFLLRPSDAAMEDPGIRAALISVLDDPVIPS